MRQIRTALGIAALAALFAVVVPTPTVVIQCADQSLWCQLFWWCDC